MIIHTAAIFVWLATSSLHQAPEVDKAPLASCDVLAFKRSTCT